MMTDTEKLLAILKEKLIVRVYTSHSKGYYGMADSIETRVDVFFGDEEICSDSDTFEMPLTQEQKHYY